MAVVVVVVVVFPAEAARGVVAFNKSAGKLYYYGGGGPFSRSLSRSRGLGLSPRPGIIPVHPAAVRRSSFAPVTNTAGSTTITVDVNVSCTRANGSF